jgi:hypothetical protein
MTTQQQTVTVAETLAATQQQIAAQAHVLAAAFESVESGPLPAATARLHQVQEKAKAVLGAARSEVYQARLTLQALLEDLIDLAALAAPETVTVAVAEPPALPAPEEKPAAEQEGEAEPDAEEPAVLPMPAAAQQTVEAPATEAPAADAPADFTDEALMTWVHEQRTHEPPVSWAAVAEALRATGRDVTPDGIRMRYNRGRKAGEQAD